MPVLSDAPFYAPLKTSLALQNGSGTPTFTRATAKWAFNDEGNLIKLPSGAIEMRGYRAVINQYSGNTDNLTGLTAGRITNIDSAAADPDGTNKAGTWRLDASAGEHYLRLQSSAFEGKYVNIAFKIKLTSYRYVALRIGSWYNFYDLQTQAWNGALQGDSRDAVISGGWVLLEMTVGPVPSGSPVFSLIFTSAALGSNWTPLGTEEAIVYQAMMSDVTGDTDKTFSDYVAGNTSYGAGANGVKYFATTKSGAAIPESNLIGAGLNPNSTTNNLLYCRDLTNAAWVKTNVTAALTQTGIDGQANASSLLTATANDATALQTITAASAAACSGFYVRRVTGTGNVYFTRDGGTNWTDLTSLINGSTLTQIKIENTSVLNPQIGFKIATSGDQIHVDAGLNHLGTELANPILTTSAAATVNAETLTYQLSGNFSDTAGTIIATVERGNWANNNGVVVGKAGSGLATSASNSGVQALDGTNTVNGPAGSTATRRKIGMKWSGSAMKTFAGGNFGASGSYDGSFNLTTIAIMPQSNGYISDVAIWPTELSDADMLAVASEQSDFSAAVSFAAAAYANVIHSVSASMPFNFGIAGYASVIHSVSAAMAIDFNAAMHANVIHSVSADMGVTFGADFDSTWIALAFHISSAYDQPIITAAYAPPSITATYN